MYRPHRRVGLTEDSSQLTEKVLPSKRIEPTTPKRTKLAGDRQQIENVFILLAPTSVLGWAKVLWHSIFLKFYEYVEQRATSSSLRSVHGTKKLH